MYKDPLMMKTSTITPLAPPEKASPSPPPEQPREKATKNYLAGRFAEQVDRFLDQAAPGARSKAAVLADLTGRTRATANQWVRGESLPDLESFRKLILAGANPYELLHVEPPSTTAQDSVGMRQLRLYDPRGTAFLDLSTDEQKVQWLTPGGRVSAGEIWVTPMLGDAMSPALNDGEILGIDASLPTFSGNGIYLLLRGSVVFVRRVEDRLAEGYALLCENEKYAQHQVQVKRFDEKSDVRLLGKVVFVCKRV